jgi:hypothetical protein
MKRQQVFVRAQLPNGRFVDADILDLEQESAIAVLANALFYAGLLSGVRDEHAEPDIMPRVRPDRAENYEREG